MSGGDHEVPITHMALSGSVDVELAELPEPSQAVDIDATREAEKVVKAVNEAIGGLSPETVADLFCKNGYWRDHLMLSWALRTVQKPTKIHEFVRECAKSKEGFRLVKLTLDNSKSFRQPAASPIDDKGEVLVITAVLTAESKLGTGVGYLRLAQESGQWKIYTLYTSLRNLNGFPEDSFERRPDGRVNGRGLRGKNWNDRRAEETNYTDGSDPKVLIIGAGQAGLTIAARLKMQKVNALIIDKNERVGDNWRKRYHNLVLHDPVWYDHLPYLNFPPQWPIFTPKDKLAGWLESYTTTMELNVWMNTRILSTSWDNAKNRWDISVSRTRDDGSEEVRLFHPHHVIQATGQSGEKYQPSIPGADSFEGHRICHSSEFPGVSEDGQGKSAVIIGSCTSAHDIAHDFVEKGYEVTMVQKSSTTVVSTDALMDSMQGLFAEGGPPTEDADLVMNGMPTSLLKTMQVQASKKTRRYDKDLLEGLTKAGYKLDDGPRESGMMFKYFQRAGGYYIDSGTSQLIVDGRIQMAQSHQIAEILPHGVKFVDGSETKADEIVFATGYQSMRTQTRQIFGDAIADQVPDVFGFNQEGEFRGLWQRTGHPGFWFHGGSLALCRYYSLLLALQIKGLEENLYSYNEI
ncbi:unnamed protein product [Clonostachys rosea f. rosea IK726]|uniref:FAD/NAD(P)-binding domain-containing protein n=2 Tax=Bionectria ochroleuca TaxID=29856 RepID=A0A0B7JKY9_BIOOC|nr:unnamed protein product [Clonostachys rosea f. rosea IK726]